MNESEIAISSLSMDLKRVALAYWNGSEKTAERFVEEALKRREELEDTEVKPYLRKLLNDLPVLLAREDKKHLAEDALMYSTLFQNYCLKFHTS